MTFVLVPGVGYANLEPETNLGAWVDRSILGTTRLWKAAKVWDPVRIVSTIPAVGTGLLGVLSGQWLRVDKPVAERIAWLFAAGNGLVAVSYTHLEVYKRQGHTFLKIEIVVLLT